MQNRRRFVPTIFLVQKPLSKICGIHCTKFEPFLKQTLMKNEPPRHRLADSVLRKLFFGERISQNTRLIFFEFGSRKRRRRGLGRNPPLAPLFVLGEFGTGYLTVPILFGSMTFSNGRIS